MNILNRRSVLGAAMTLAAGSSPTAASAQDLRSLFGSPAMPDLTGAVAWLNSAPLRTQDLRGKVVLVQFWTFTCVNWQRTLPALNAWWAKYKDHGLVVIGAHTPEFSFERDVANVREATAQLGITFPVAVDSNQAIWNAFRNNAWPALYLVDAKGAIRYRHDGEGEYANSEMAIQRLLAEAGAKNVPGGVVRAEGRGSQAGADWTQLRSQETYTGYQKAEGFRSAGGMARDRKRTYELPARMADNTWASSGDWLFGPEAARSEGPASRIVYRFHARDVNLVMGAMRRDKPVAFRVRIDGQSPGAQHGSDTDPGGRGVMQEKRLYQLVRQSGQVTSRDFEIEFAEAGAEVYCFTFG